MEKYAKRMKGKRPEFLIDTTKGKDMKRGFTLFLCFSREWCIHNFFAAFNHLKIDMENCHLMVIDNSDLAGVRDGLLKKLEVYKDFFYTTRLLKTWRQGGRELVTQEHKEWHVGKLPYIYEMQKDMMRLCTTERFVILEDDTLPPYKEHPEVVMRLLGLLDENPKAGVASAVATGRAQVAWVKTRLGVHYLERDGNRVLWRLSPNTDLKGVHKMDACGWYCCASYRDVWVKAFEGMDGYIEEVPRFAMDVVHTNNIKRAGRDVLVDFGLWCEHMNHSAEGIIFWGKRQARPQIDVWMPEWKTYAQGVLLTEPAHKKVIMDIVRDRDK
jgi:hypothetical protein